MNMVCININQVSWNIEEIFKWGGSIPQDETVSTTRKKRKISFCNVNYCDCVPCSGKSTLTRNIIKGLGSYSMMSNSSPFQELQKHGDILC